MMVRIQWLESEHVCKPVHELPSVGRVHIKKKNQSTQQRSRRAQTAGEETAEDNHAGRVPLIPAAEEACCVAPLVGAREAYADDASGDTVSLIAPCRWSAEEEDEANGDGVAADAVK
jgi:hypothetical protein